jgi:hypothetical protein
MLDYVLQFRVFLPHDLFQLYGLHSGILQLCKRASSLDRCTLPPISDQQDAIVRTKPLDKLMHLTSRSE